MGGPTGNGSSNKVFVGGLPQNCSDDVLTNYFMQYGTITDSVVMKDRETGRSRGFGFVTFDSVGAVDMIMSQYDDHKVEGKWIEVKRATPKDQMPAGGGGGGGKGGGKNRDGDWTCSCGANVFASKDTCFKCGARRPEGGGGRGRSRSRSPPRHGDPGMYGMPPMGYGMPPGYGAPPGYPGYPPGYGAPPGYPGYPPGYGMPPGYGAPPGYPGYPPGYGMPPGYGAPPGYPGYPGYPSADPSMYGAYPGYPSAAPSQAPPPVGQSLADAPPHPDTI